MVHFSDWNGYFYELEKWQKSIEIIFVWKQETQGYILPYGKYNLKKYLTTRNFPNFENFEKDLSNCSLKNWPFIFSLVVLLLFDITGYILIDFGKKPDVFQMYPLDINYLPKYKTKKSRNNKKIPSTSE